MPSAADILARLDSAIRELLELRAEVAASMPAANGAGSEGADIEALRAAGCERIYSEYG
jgi:hypothetical protein